ncbi:MAG: hypothetical protein NZT92_23025 [Abditibacteriales bacterium]|nr:hypothetical protein [Abditibacteriales bacterium]MDW8368483.1 hypothetical protein [Abditibacteriales bacterium]
MFKALLAALPDEVDFPSGSGGIGERGTGDGFIRGVHAHGMEVPCAIEAEVCQQPAPVGQGIFSVL